MESVPCHATNLYAPGTTLIRLGTSSYFHSRNTSARVFSRRTPKSSSAGCSCARVNTISCNV